jgi:hypothetical protein
MALSQEVMIEQNELTHVIGPSTAIFKKSSGVVKNWIRR